jgi:SAM-dependent methyltransferase
MQISNASNGSAEAKERRDAVGRALMDAYSGKGGFLVIERDDGVMDLDHPLRRYFSHYDEWPQSEQRAIDCAAGRVIDIGAGGGRHSLRIQAQGLSVTAIDISPGAVELCRLRGIIDARVAGIAHVGSMDGPFDTVVMLGNNFGLFGSFDGAKRLLRRLTRCTNSDAQIIAQTLDPYQTTDPMHLAYHNRNRCRGRMGGQVRIRARYKKFSTPWFDYLFASPSEMAEIVDGAGWIIEETWQGDGPTYFARLKKTGTVQR